MVSGAGRKARLMKDDFQLIVEVMKDALLRKLGDEVDLIFQYGS
jgi:hypothetical protein